VRYPPDHKEQTRERIIGAASRSFRRSGGEGIGIAELMKDLQLTHGGFYRHFENKEHLFAEALAASLEEMGTMLERAAAAGDRAHGLTRIIDTYLSPAHCANPAEGCPVAALAPELPRHSATVKKAYHRALQSYAARLSRFMPGEGAAEKRRNFHVLFAGMAGTLAMARSIDDETARRQLLRSAKEFYTAAFSGRC
jgi:TetR/AcrR family transcriptional regulator, transcriptional repressor for nem operon